MQISLKKKKLLFIKAKKKNLSIRKQLKITIDPYDSILGSCLKKKVKINNKLKKFCISNYKGIISLTYKKLLQINNSSPKKGKYEKEMCICVFVDKQKSQSDNISGMKISTASVERI